MSIRRAFAFIGVSVVLLISLLVLSNEPSAKANSKTVAPPKHTKVHTEKKKQETVVEKQLNNHDVKQKVDAAGKETPTSPSTETEKSKSPVQKKPSENKVNQPSQIVTEHKVIENKVAKKEDQKVNQQTVQKNNQNTQSTPPPKSNSTITAIGDSILVDVEPYLKKMFPSIKVDAEIGRQMYQALDVVKRMKNNGELGNVVIIELGTNGPFTNGQLDTMIKTIGVNKKIIFVNTRVPRPWQNVVNTTLNSVTSKYPNTSLINWFSASANHNDYFEPDGVHLNPKGASAYASLVANMVK